MSCPPRKCSVIGCEKVLVAKGMCMMHYKRVRKHGDPYHVTKQIPPSQRRHGQSWIDGKPSAEYRIWSGMKSRCENPRMRDFPKYGGRGISVCKRWSESFENFLADMGPRPSSAHSLDRFPDNNGNYAAENCRWATSKEQCRNKRTNRLVIWQGEEMPAAEAIERSGMSEAKVRNRLRRGWPHDRAFS